MFWKGGRETESRVSARARGFAALTCVSASTATMSDVMETMRISLATRLFIKSSTAMVMMTHGFTIMNCATELLRKRARLRELEKLISGDESSQFEYTVGVPQHGNTW